MVGESLFPDFPVPRSRAESWNHLFGIHTLISKVHGHLGCNPSPQGPPAKNEFFALQRLQLIPNTTFCPKIHPGTTGRWKHWEQNCAGKHGTQTDPRSREPHTRSLNPQTILPKQSPPNTHIPSSCLAPISLVAPWSRSHPWQGLCTEAAQG